LTKIDLRSDTVTKPVPEMREAIAQAEVGDDVYMEDHTIQKLQKTAADILGKESSLFVPSGSMGNQIAINVHTHPGDEVILDSECHIFNYEMGAMSAVSGVLPQPIETSKKYLPVPQVKKKVKPEQYYYSNTALITVENTNNRRGGTVYPSDKKEELIDFAKERNIPVHLDGARIFNASIATEKPVDKLVQGFDSVMVSLSKGLGAPVGSIIAGSNILIEKARRVRKILGGGMRQVGILGAAGLYALENHIDRLKKDHENARILARSLEDLDRTEVNEPETNIVMLTLKENSSDENEVVEKLKEKNILVGTMGPRRLRLVTHMGISEENVQEAAEAIKNILS